MGWCWTEGHDGQDRERVGRDEVGGGRRRADAGDCEAISLEGCVSGGCGPTTSSATRSAVAPSSARIAKRLIDVEGGQGLRASVAGQRAAKSRGESMLEERRHHLPKTSFPEITPAVTCPAR